MLGPGQPRLPLPVPPRLRGGDAKPTGQARVPLSWQGAAGFVVGSGGSEGSANPRAGERGGPGAADGLPCAVPRVTVNSALVFCF